MFSIPQSLTPPPCQTFRATLGDVEGVAVRDEAGRVFFASDADGIWQELFDTDLPRFMLFGNVAAIVAAAEEDGDLYQAVERRTTYPAVVAAQEVSA